MSISIEGDPRGKVRVEQPNGFNLKKTLKRILYGKRKNANDELRESQSAYLGILLGTMVNQDDLKQEEAWNISNRLITRGAIQDDVQRRLSYLIAIKTSVPYSDPRFQTDVLVHFWPEFPEIPQVD